MVERVSQALNRFKPENDLARYISHFTNPMFIAIPLVLGVTWRGTTSWAQTLRWGGLYLVLTDLIPMGVLSALARRGRVSDLHHARQRERVQPLLISLACLGLALAICHSVDTPPLLRRLAWLQFAQTALMTIITPFWQISFHGAASGGLVTAFLLLYGVSTWPLLILLPLVGWSQVERDRHSTAQMVAGMSVSILLYGLGFGL